MPTAVVDADTFTATINVPNDGEAANQASLLTNFVQGLANRTTNIRKGVPGIAPSMVYRIPIAASHNNSGARFSKPTAGNDPIVWVQSSVADAGGLSFELPLQAVGTISRVAVRVDGNGGGFSHGGFPVGTMPRIKLFRTTNDSGLTSTQIGSTAIDGSGTVGAYETPHFIEITGQSQVISANFGYFVVLEGEAGANSVANALALYWVEVTIVP